MSRWLLSRPPAQLRLALQWAALGILLAGFASGAWIWYDQDRTEREIAASRVVNPADSLPLLDSRKQVRQVEMYYGKTGVLAEKADELLHGKPLAKTIAIASAVIAGGLLLIAARVAAGPDGLGGAGNVVR